jgi:hypothetical protein
MAGGVRLVGILEADQRARQIHEPQQDVGAPLIAHLQPPIADQPGKRPLHHIAVVAQPLARLDATPGNPRADPPPAQRPPATRVVVTLVTVQLGRALAGSARPPTRALDRRDGVHHGLQQHGVMGVRRRQTDRQWHSTAVDQQVVPGPGPGPVCRVRAGQLAPLGTHAHAVQAGPRPVELAIAAELVQQHLMPLLPHPGALPVPQPPPAGDRAATAELAGRQQPPGDTGAQLVDNAGQRGAVINSGAAAIAGRWSGQQGLDGLPQLLGNKGLDSGHDRGSWP